MIEAHLMKTLKILRLNTGCHGDGAVSSKNSVMLNVYEDFYPKEYAKAKLIIEAIVKTSNVYLQQWPDHPVLNQVPFIRNTLLCIVFIIYTHSHRL